MQYKYYKNEGTSYLLQKPMTMLYFVMIVFGLLAVFALWHGIDTGSKGGFVWAALCAFFAWFPYYRQKRMQVCFDTHTQMIRIMHGGKVRKEYPFNSFLNFTKTRVRNNGITTQWHVSMYLDEKGKNKNVLLALVFRQKTADEIIAETSSIMESADANNTTHAVNTTSFNTYRSA